MDAFSIAKYADRKNVGDTLEFGRYLIPGGSKPYRYPTRVYKDIEWIILAHEGTRMLLLSRDCVDWEFIDGTGDPQTWENCFARRDILPEFLKASFTEEEKSLIVPVWLKTADNPVFGTKGGADTEDSIFLLSLEEFQKYVPESEAAAALFMLESRSDVLWDRENQEYELYREYMNWWLRTPGAEQNCNVVVNQWGEADLEGLENHCDEIGIRPAIWIDLAAGSCREEPKPFVIRLLDDDDLPF